MQSQLLFIVCGNLFSKQPLLSQAWKLSCVISSACTPSFLSLLENPCSASVKMFKGQLRVGVQSSETQSVLGVKGMLSAIEASTIQSSEYISE